MESFKIASYKVSTHLHRITGGTRFERVLELLSETEAHGYRRRVTMAFSNAFDSTWSTPVAGYLTFNSSIIEWMRFACWMNLKEFEFYYHILQTERPVVFEYRRRETGVYRSGYLARVGLTTEQEPVGEGLGEVFSSTYLSAEKLQELMTKDMTELTLDSDQG
jgi:hypothetical protein